jgi:hypothetical protein
MDEGRVSEKLRRIVQVVTDIAGTQLHNLGVLDLACLEGGYAIEFARQGAKAVGIEGREASVMKARFVKAQVPCSIGRRSARRVLLSASTLETAGDAVSWKPGKTSAVVETGFGRTARLEAPARGPVDRCFGPFPATAPMGD